MASNRLSLIYGAAASYDIALTGSDGTPLTVDRLTGARATVHVRSTPAGTDILTFQMPDLVHLVLTPTDANLNLSFTVADVAALGLGSFFYQIEMLFAAGDIEIPIAWTPLGVITGGSSAIIPPVFTNTVKLDHDYGLSGSLQYMTPGGTPISTAQVRVYLKSDYDAGLLTAPVGVTQTTAAGTWLNPILVAPGFSYTIQFFKPNEYGPDVQTVVA